MEVITAVLGNVWTMFGETITEFNTYPVMWLATALGLAGALIGLIRRATRVGGGRRR